MDDRIRRDGITLIGLSVANLCDASAIQMALPFADGSSLDAALDDLRDKFGGDAIGRASNVGRDMGFGVPMLPDVKP